LLFKAGETAFVISNSGRNSEPVEVAQRLKELGLHMVAVTSMAHSKSVSSRHSSGKKPYQVSEVVLDTGTPPGDAALDFRGFVAKAGTVSTVLGAALMNAVMAEAIQYMLDHGFEPPVLKSANLDGSDEYNARVMARYPGHLSSTFGVHA
jgi:uncharacterized phosphosugar-binding protein